MRTGALSTRAHITTKLHENKIRTIARLSTPIISLGPV